MNALERNEKLAEIEHESWSDWMRHVFSRGTFLPDGNFVMNTCDVDRWTRQMETPYSKLSEEEKDSDRREVKRYLRVLRNE